MTVTIVTDSVSCLPAELAASFDVSVVPAWISVGGERTRDGETPVEAILERRDRATTAGPSPGEFLAALDGKTSADGAVIVTVSDRLSSTHRSAELAAARFDGPVRVVDSTTVAGAEGLVVLAAAEAARRGADLDEVERVARRAAEEVRLVALVPDLGAIARTGRLPEAVVRVAGRARVRVVIELARGRIRPLRPRIGGDRLDPLIDRWRASRGLGHLQVAALHAGDERGAADLLDRLSRECVPGMSFVAPFAASMIAHTGPGLLGLAWRWAA